MSAIDGAKTYARFISNQGRNRYNDFEHEA